jgi:hypothetical protein
MLKQTISKEVLNNTLEFIVKLLNDNNIQNWFISYGTLLGIIRNDSCIEGDDDVDIIIEKSNYDVLKNLLIENDIEIWDLTNKLSGNNLGNILKTKYSEKYCSIDFYMASINKNGDFHDLWEEKIWSECYNENKELPKRIWHGELLNLPANPETKLCNRYGENWRIPQNNKGPKNKHIY